MEKSESNDVILQILSLKDIASMSNSLLLEIIKYDQIHSLDSKYPSNITEATTITKLSAFFLIKPSMLSYITVHQLKSDIFFYNLWNFYLPFCLNLQKTFQNNKKPVLQGILGVQGAGKTTFADIATEILSSFGLNVIGFSIDDIYKTYAERQEIKKKDPRIKWRGPPGTHDISIALSLLTEIKKHGENLLKFPIFDKSLFSGEGDRLTEVKSIEKVDIVLFEGWFLGMRPLKTEFFNEKNHLFKSSEEQSFAIDMSKKLQEYEVLWDLLDDIIVLWPESLEMSKVWRLEAEKKMRDTGKESKTDKEIEEFVDYFWKALPPELYIQNMMNEKLISFRFIFGSNHQLSKIESF